LEKVYKIFPYIILAVLMTGCNANTIAVNKLNGIARGFMNDNDYKNALTRLESSYELDYGNYQTRYMLTCAYLRENMCNQALEHALFIIDTKPDEPAVHLLGAESYVCVAKGIYNNSLTDPNTKNILIKDQRDLKKYIYNLKKANEEYDKYYDLAPNVENSDGILNKIKENNENIAKMEVYTVK